MKWLVLFLIPGILSHGQEAKPWGPIFLDAIKGLMEWQPRAKGLEYEFRSEEKKIASDGSVKERTNTRIEFKQLDGYRWAQVMERNGTPTTEAQRKEQQEKSAARIALLKNETAANRERKQRESIKKRNDQMGFVEEFPNAFDFQLVEQTKIAGREISVVSFTPRKGYRPGQMRARIFTKLNGKAWLDPTEKQAVKMIVDIFDDFSIGGFVANLGKGTRFEFNQVRFDNSVWLPSSIYSRLMARLLVFKSYNTEETESFSNYRKP